MTPLEIAFVVLGALANLVTVGTAALLIVRAIWRAANAFEKVAEKVNDHERRLVLIEGGSRS